jgi:hypothetical protein
VIDGFAMSNQAHFKTFPESPTFIGEGEKGATLESDPIWPHHFTLNNNRDLPIWIKISIKIRSRPVFVSSPEN